MAEAHSIVPPLLSAVPFILMLLGIAVLPLAVPRFWESNRNKALFSILLGAPIVVWTESVLPIELAHVIRDYIAFILLLGSLFVISGGIYLAGDLRVTPVVNAGFLAFGAVLANLIGTTGASMVLIRPLLRTNGERRHVAHTVVFFIFLVSNVGGSLTPLGDPPLFLGYLNGVPFLWTLRLWPFWLGMTVALLAIYLIWDRVLYAREDLTARQVDRTRQEPLRLHGARNLFFLAGIIAAVAFLPPGWREAAMVLLALASLKVTSGEIRACNHFSWSPIVEVAVLFAGIFATMVPVLQLLRVRGAALGVEAPWEFFWATGTLSSFLDNAPTYLTFFHLAQGLGLPAEVAGMPDSVLTGISLGAVFMGANTYIGNGPNFMVKAIAEARGVRMPSFGGYMLYSGVVLLPLFVILSWVFL
ncbi:MAG TPA: sodium:proton antiporter [Gemmatimonadota bacterium]|nr:sodium:proton antiporter [Gemmatimonadota bacterium]